MIDYDRLFWSSGYRTCDVCSETYHLAGTLDCACPYDDDDSNVEFAVGDHTARIVAAQNISLGGE